MNFYWLNEESRLFLSRGYLKEGQSGEERVMEIALTAEKILGEEGFAEKFYKNMSKGWYSLSSPVWSNFGNKRGLPISCYGSYIGDSIESILYTVAEAGVMSKLGGGTSAYFGNVRGRGTEITGNGKSNGTFPFLRLFDTSTNVISQGSTRRGQFAGYIDIEHPDIKEWLEIKHQGNPIQDIFYGVCVSSKWLEEMIDGDSGKREIWAKVIQKRGEIGIPYILFKDNVNDNLPQHYIDNGAKVYSSNLCSEICLPTNEDESFVCCLSSMNIEKYDQWAGTDAVRVMVRFLDAVMEEFIEKSKGITFMERAHLFAKNHRALGLGVLGLHSYLMSKSVPFEGLEARLINLKIFKEIKNEAEAASAELALKYGEPKATEGYGRRNSTLMAVAPTKSSSHILGQVSQGIEPILSNYYVKNLAKVKSTYKNPYLKEVLAKKGFDTDEVWDSILKYDGSVQHLDMLDEHEKNVFKKFKEISPFEIVSQAGARQKFICQSQSLNLFVHPDMPTKEVNRLYLEAWKAGVKTLYYQINENAAQQFSMKLTQCSSCEG